MFLDVISCINMETDFIHSFVVMHECIILSFLLFIGRNSTENIAYLPG